MHRLMHTVLNAFYAYKYVPKMQLMKTSGEYKQDAF